MVEIVDFKPRNKHINEDVVAALEHYLEKAKAGEIIAVGIAAVMNTGDMYTTVCKSDCYPALLGAISMLQNRALNNVIVS
jgi:hypothetical protein